MAVAAKASGRDRIIGVQAQRFPAMSCAVKGVTPSLAPAPSPKHCGQDAGQIDFAVVRQWVSDIELVMKVILSRRS